MKVHSIMDLLDDHETFLYDSSIAPLAHPRISYRQNFSFCIMDNATRNPHVESHVTLAVYALPMPPFHFPLSSRMDSFIFFSKKRLDYDQQANRAYHDRIECILLCKPSERLGSG